ncbi:MAG: M20 family metallopeptidase [Thermomicrobiales bacterium]|nr:M20 family metallopeptidase [Thermomicrobiales bacterium]
MTADPIAAYLDSHLDDYLDDLRVLCAIDSGSDDKAGVDQVQQWLAPRLTGLGFAVTLEAQEEFGDDLIAVRSGSGSRRVMLLGHADTVYPRGTAAQRPVTITDDIVLGPGTCDMKAGLLAGIYAVRALDAAGWNNLDRLTFVVVSDEEISQRHSVEMLRAQGPQHDAILTLEAARENGDIVTARKAGCWLSVNVTGKAAHAGVEPEKGRSATVALGHILAETFKLNGLKPGMTVNPGDIAGGRAPNIVADSAFGHFDLRAWTNADLEELRQAFIAVASREYVPGVVVDISMDGGSGMPAMERTAGVERLEAAAIDIAAEIGFPLKGASTGGGSDISYAGYSGTPGLDGLGPVGGLDHGPEEYILKSSIVPRIALLSRLIQRIGDDERLSYDQRRP